MAEISYSRIPAGDTELLDEVMGYHFRVIQTGALQMQLLHVANTDILETLSRGRPLMAFYQTTADSFRRCLQHGTVIGAWDNYKLIGYTAYSPSIGHMLDITHRPDESVALVNFFRMGERKDMAGAKGLASALLDDLRECGQHRRLAFVAGMAASPDEWNLQRVLKPTTFGFDDYGRFRVAGLNAADMSMGIVRRSANFKASTFKPRDWRQ